MRLAHSRFASGIRQRGAVLVTAMLLLLVLTIIGVTVMQMSRMQERMAGNSRDVNLAFQAAEAGLRNAEQFIEDLEGAPVACAPPAVCEVRLEGSMPGNIGLKNDAWWTANGQGFGVASLQSLHEPPRTVVEQLGFVRTDGGVVEGDVPDGRDFYQVTSRSTGGSGLADVVLQSTYTVKH